MTTYTIATLKSTGLLIACEPDGADMEAAISAEEATASVEFDRDDITIESGLILTDDDSTGEVRYSGFDMGRLTDESGVEFRYAVRRAPGRPAEMKGGKRVNVYLDDASLARAAKLGDGNVSEGIRRALQG